MPTPATAPPLTSIRPARMPKAAKPPANKKVTDECVAAAVMAMARRFSKSQVKAILKAPIAMGGFNLANRSCERAIAKARAEMAKSLGKTTDELRSEAYLFYDSVLRDNDASTRERLLAQERIDKLYGSEGPIKVNLGDSDAHKLARELMASKDGAQLLEQMDDLLAAQRTKK